MTVCGTLHVHSCPPALTPHVEWALSNELGVRVTLSWREQPVGPGMLRTEGTWRGRIGAAGRLASVLKGWSMLLFDVTEEPSTGCDGTRYSFTPTLGLFSATTSANGDVVVGEQQLRAVLTGAPYVGAVPVAIETLLGTAWDAELEPFRQAAADGPAARLLSVV
ncbi:MAG: hypothetical protein QOI42_1636 [Frankiaceae bacterium]|nr:hypothetical protein [Frankiaceae bacterium]